MLIRKSFLVILASILFLTAGAGQNAVESSNGASEEASIHIVLSKPDFKDHLAKLNDYILVDVRRPEEYDAGHIEGAININFLDPPVFEKEFSKMDTAQTLMIYCRSGKRSRRSAEKLQEMGFKKVYDLEGGYLNWQKQD